MDNGLYPNRPTNTRQNINDMSTAIITGCGISINSGNNKQVDFEPGRVQFIDNTTNALQPVFIEKVFPGIQGVDIVIAGVGTHYALKKDLTIEKESFSGLDTASQMRDQLELGAAVHIGDTPITRVLPFYSNIMPDHQLSMVDGFRAMGRVRQNGLRISANSTNLKVDRAAGVEYSPFFENFQNSKKDPSTLTFSEMLAFDFFHTWKDGSGSWNTGAIVDVITPGVYDDGTGGVGAPNGAVGNNSAQIMRVFEVNESPTIQYGQQTYISINQAVDAIATEQFEASIFAVNTAFRGHLVVRGGATDLSDPADALFFAPTSDFVLQRA